jgi:hypothetical protein
LSGVRVEDDDRSVLEVVAHRREVFPDGGWQGPAPSRQPPPDQPRDRFVGAQQVRIVLAVSEPLRDLRRFETADRDQLIGGPVSDPVQLLPVHGIRHDADDDDDRDEDGDRDHQRPATRSRGHLDIRPGSGHQAFVSREWIPTVEAGIGTPLGSDEWRPAGGARRLPTGGDNVMRGSF